ncbi:MAG: NAD(P)-dependent oxidoreductase [Halobacteriaceae archaeon]
MSRYLVVHPDFELTWPQAPDYLYEFWSADRDVAYVRVDADDDRPLSAVLDDPADVEKLVCLGVPVTGDCLDALANLEEATVMDGAYGPDEAVHEELRSRGVALRAHESGDFWGESVAELGVGLTIGAMRRIPQKRAAMTESRDPWDRDRWEAGADRGYGGLQGTDDDPFYTHGTVAGTRVRAVGVGNIGSRYLDYLGAMGADVAAHDPYAPDAAFHRIGARRVHHLDAVLEDAEVFAPLLPVTDETRGLIDRERVDALPEGCLLVLITRAAVTDFEAVRERVTSDEIALAADVFDAEPLDVDDPLLGRDNVVHTPHVGGRTERANEEWARQLLARFDEGSA